VRDPDGVLLTLLIGVAGALLGGFLSVALGWTNLGDRSGMLGALVGAVGALALKTWAVHHEGRTRTENLHGRR
ncbi:MAG TPA: hypothetical protein VF135_13975, partial [Terriglobales bacterium]